MTKTILLAFLMLWSIAGFTQEVKPTYDSTLAKSLGADDYGMKSYILAILKTGTYQTTDKAILDSLFRGHMDNINRLAESGQLVVAGPMGKNDKQYRGIFILNTTSMEEAAEWLNNDAAINSKLFEVEYFPWYGSAALPAYMPVHKKIEKQQH